MKLSYRRETVRQLRMSIWLTDRVMEVISETYENNYSNGKTARLSILTTPLRFDDSYLTNAF